MRRTKEEAEQTRRDLLDAALTIFSKEGYEAARLADIAKAASVTRGAIYHHFGSKAELYIALMDDAAAVGNQAIEKAIAKGGSLVETLERILVTTMNLLEEDRRFREVMALSLFGGSTSPELAQVTRRRYDEAHFLVENLRGYFRMGIAQGDLRPDIDPATAARAFLAFQNGIAMLWLSNRDAFSIKEEAPSLADMYIRGIVKT